MIFQSVHKNSDSPILWRNGLIPLRKTTKAVAISPDSKGGVRQRKELAVGDLFHRGPWIVILDFGLAEGAFIARA